MVLMSASYVPQGPTRLFQEQLNVFLAHREHHRVKMEASSVIHVLLGSIPLFQDRHPAQPVVLVVILPLPE
jgi:hypothetical protein